MKDCNERTDEILAAGDNRDTIRNIVLETMVETRKDEAANFAPPFNLACDKTMRQYYKAMALMGLLASPKVRDKDGVTLAGPNSYTITAADYADAMIAEDEAFAGKEKP